MNKKSDKENCKTVLCVPSGHSAVQKGKTRNPMIRRICLCFLLFCVLLGTGGCRQRIHPGERNSGTGAQGNTGVLQTDTPGTDENAGDNGSGLELSDAALSPQLDEPDSKSETRENPESHRKEYDSSAEADIRAGEPQRIQGQGTGNGFFEYASDGLSAVARINPEAEKSATQLNWVEESDRISAGEAGDTAESALQYYTLLLSERTESLFECKRKVCYLEMPEKYVTIHKSSQMHALLTKAGLYSVSARLRESDLVVDDGWIVRKNPDMIVKMMPVGFFENGGGKAEAGRILKEIGTRTGFEEIGAVRNRLMLVLAGDVLENPYMNCAGALVLASFAYPELFEDVDLAQALGMLQDESGMDGTALYFTQDGGQE